MIHSQHCNIYIASCVPDGGIYQFHLHKDGSLKYISHTQMDRPMYMTISENKMYILLREPFDDNGNSGLVIYDLNENGNLINPSEIVDTKGKIACHLSVDEGAVYCANYISGSIIKMPDKVVKHRGKGIHPIRQDAPHAHYITMTPDKKYVCAVDLGLDTVYLYNKDLECTCKTKVPEGNGARHLVFSDDSKFCFVANELKSTVSIMEYDGESLKYIDTVSCLPEGYTGDTTASAIRFLDNRVYVSNRGLDTISVLEFYNGNLIYKDTYSCGGKCPRDFDIIDNYIICTNECSDNVAILDNDSFNLIYTETNIPKPICVLKYDI